MYEKVNPAHPDKIADRIAGAIVDLAYKLNPNPKIAVEVLIGHGICHIIAETDTDIGYGGIDTAVKRIAGNVHSNIVIVDQDQHLANNQSNGYRCGDNGIFRGEPITDEQIRLTRIAQEIYREYNSDGKYILNGEQMIICQSGNLADSFMTKYKNATINPLGKWTGGTNVDAGATNRKLGSDMGDAITGGGLHGKDLSKADVSVNIYAFLKAQQSQKPIQFCCAIGDREIDGKPYCEIVEIAKEYINNLGGFEKLAEWGLIR